MVEILIAWLFQCLLIPDANEFGICLDNFIVEFLNTNDEDHDW